MIELATAIYILLICFFAIGLLVWRSIILRSNRRIMQQIKELECQKPSTKNHYPSLHEYNRLFYVLNDNWTDFLVAERRVRGYEQDAKR